VGKLPRPNNNIIDMKIRVAVLVFFGSAALLLADPAIENAQRALKDQGFYYGEITGQKDTDTIAAIRRYQIRNGLQVTGDLNDETMKSLGADSSNAGAVAKASPSSTPDTSDLRSESREQPEPGGPRQSFTPTNPLTGQPFPEVPDRQQPRPDDGEAVPQRGGLFAGTPYETSPPQVQRDVIASAQTVLSQRNLYHSQIDGAFGPDMEFSLRAYQSRVGIPVTGRLDLKTLAALQLLPGSNEPRFAPRQRIFPGRPVRGEWIHE
jgi:peptidoglycan hydrolase-like protein with peptidoglycan-binding domain